jgi:hypothetical protein
MRLVPLILSLLFLLQFSIVTKSQIIYKKNDRIIIGNILKIDSVNVYYKEITNLEGETIVIPKSEIYQIKFDEDINAKKIKLTKKYERAKNAVSFGFGGTGGIVSINYDRVILGSKDFFLSAKLGIGSWLSQTNINAHITGNYNFGKSKHYLEFGIGAAAGLTDFNRFHRYYASLPILGYRYHPQSEKMFFRTYACIFALLKDPSNSDFFLPMLAVDLGYCF